MKAYIYTRESDVFPIELKFTLNNVKYNLVFEDAAQAKNWFSCRYGINKRDYNKTFIDRTNEKR